MNGKKHPLLPRLALAFGVMLCAASHAQQSAADSGFAAPNPARQDVEVAPAPKPAPYDIGGILAQAFKLKKPFQMINPLAPAKDGDGRNNVSWDPDKPEKPKGIILLGIQW